MTDFKPGDIVEIIDDSNGDTAAGAVGQVILSPEDKGSSLSYLRFTNEDGWYVTTSTMKHVSKLFPKKLTSTHGT